MKPLKTKMLPVTAAIACIIAVSLHVSLRSQDNGAEAYMRYCSRCHGHTDRRSGNLVFHSKQTITERFENRSLQLLDRLVNIDKYVKSHLMIRAVHKIDDKVIIIRIVNHLSDPDLKIPDRLKKEKGKGKGI